MPSPLRLIAITDPLLMPWHDLEPACRLALAKGLPALMLRDTTDTTDRQMLVMAHRLAGEARGAGALLIVNRRLELAGAIGARAVHLGKEGPTIADARGTLGPEIMIGYSAHEKKEALDAFASGADYVTFSPIFDTPSKRGKLKPRGLEALRELCRAAPGPVVALGGIDASNIAQVMAAGATGMAAIRAVFDGDPEKNVPALMRGAGFR